MNSGFHDPKVDFGLDGWGINLINKQTNNQVRNSSLGLMFGKEEFICCASILCLLVLVPAKFHCYVCSWGSNMITGDATANGELKDEPFLFPIVRLKI